MDAKQHLYYALGILAYALAKSDGVVQREERERLHELIFSKTGHQPDFDYAEIIFQLLHRDEKSLDGSFEWAMEAFEKGKHHFDDSLKQQFVFILEEVARAFPPISAEEQQLLMDFSQWLKTMKSTSNS